MEPFRGYEAEKADFATRNIGGTWILLFSLASMESASLIPDVYLCHSIINRFLVIYILFRYLIDTAFEATRQTCHRPVSFGFYAFSFDEKGA